MPSCSVARARCYCGQYATITQPLPLHPFASRSWHMQNKMCCHRVQAERKNSALTCRQRKPGHNGSFDLKHGGLHIRAYRRGVPCQRA
eukprot:11071551-Alexandrium_andersonii.AAC.1